MLKNVHYSNTANEKNAILIQVQWKYNKGNYSKKTRTLRGCNTSG